MPYLILAPKVACRARCLGSNPPYGVFIAPYELFGLGKVPEPLCASESLSNGEE